MKRIPFLTAEEIALKQAQEAASDKPQKKTAEQIEAIYSSGQNILVSASAGSGKTCLLYTSPSPRDLSTSRMPSSA